MPNQTEIDIRKATSINVAYSFSEDEVRRRIYTIRGTQVMLDRDLAYYFKVDTKVLNQAVKRNIKRFPDRFMFQMTELEWQDWKSQFVTTNYMSTEEMNAIKIGVRRPPYAFSEEGVAQLSAVLHSEIAIEASIRIIDAFVSMRRFLIQNAGLFQRLEQLEHHQFVTDNRVEETNNKIETVISRLDDGSLKHKLGMFFDGQMFDSFSLIEELVKRAQNRVILIDDYVDANVLEHFRLRGRDANVDIYVNQRHQTVAMKQMFDLYHKQYPAEHVELHTFNKSHDRWLIIDDEVYHFGASIKDLGLKWFSVNKVTEFNADEIIARLING